MSSEGQGLAFDPCGGRDGPLLAVGGGGCELAAVVERLRSPLPVEADPGEVAARLALVQRVRGWLDGVEAGLVQTFDRARGTVVASGGLPGSSVRGLDDEVAFVQRSTRTHAARARRRGGLLDELPSLSGVLAAGHASGDHVDAVAGALSGLPAPVRSQVLAVHGEEIADWAAGTDPVELSTRVRALGDRVAGDAGASRRDRQRRDTRLRTWVHRHTQMVHFAGQFDPARGIRLQQRLARAVETLFHDTLPADAPDDPAERQDFLRAHALADLLLSTGRPTGAGGEIIVIVDSDNLCTGREHHDTLIDVAGAIDPTEIDPADVRHWLTEPGTTVVPVIVDAHGVVTRVGRGIPAHSALLPTGPTPDRLAGPLRWDHVRLAASFRRAPPLDLGRSTRLASHAQRIALRVMHPTCTVLECSIRFEHTEPHHVRWWGRDHGPTDLADLAALCGHHHDDVHHHGWTITLGPHREVRVHAPGIGTTTGPPPRAHHDALRRRRRAARAPAAVDAPPQRRAVRQSTSSRSSSR